MDAWYRLYHLRNYDAQLLDSSECLIHHWQVIVCPPQGNSCGLGERERRSKLGATSRWLAVTVNDRVVNEMRGARGRAQTMNSMYQIHARELLLQTQHSGAKCDERTPPPPRGPAFGCIVSSSTSGNRRYHTPLQGRTNIHEQAHDFFMTLMHSLK